jgi:hypothetical protein
MQSVDYRLEVSRKPCDSTRPFGGMEEDGIENNFPANFRTREAVGCALDALDDLTLSGGDGSSDESGTARVPDET